MHRVITAAALITVTIIATSAAGPAWAGDFISGTQLARACASTAAGDKAACDGYIAGALDVVLNTAELKNTVCPPSGVKLSALREAVGRFGQLHTEDTKNGGIPLLHAMMKATYPCPDQAKPR